MLTYHETKHATQSAHQDGASSMKDRTLAQLRSRKLENDSAAPRSPAEHAYRKGFNEALAAIEEWLEGVTP